MDNFRNREHEQTHEGTSPTVQLLFQRNLSIPGLSTMLIPNMGMRTALRTFCGGFLENQYSRVKSIFFIKFFFRPNQALEHVKLCIEIHFRFTK